MCQHRLLSLFKKHSVFDIFEGLGSKVSWVPKPVDELAYY